MLLGNFNETGGRQIHQDDLQILQTQLYTAVQDQYKGSGAFILSGCQVSGTLGNYTIGEGLVYVDGLILKFDQVTGISAFPKYIHQATPLNQDSFTLELGGTAYKRTLYKSELVNSIPSLGEYITMTATGGRNYNDVLANNFLRLSGNQTINGTKTFTSTIAGSISGLAATAMSATTALNATNAGNASTLGGNSASYYATQLNLKANKAQAAWTNISTSSPWSVQNRTLQYRIDTLGKVHLRGEVWTIGTALTSGTLKIADIPSAIRPNQDAWFAIEYYDGTSRRTNSIYVDSSNNIFRIGNGYSAQASAVSFDGISYWLD